MNRQRVNGRRNIEYVAHLRFGSFQYDARQMFEQNVFPFIFKRRQWLDMRIYRQLPFVIWGVYVTNFNIFVSFGLNVGKGVKEKTIRRKTKEIISGPTSTSSPEPRTSDSYMMNSEQRQPTV